MNTPPRRAIGSAAALSLALAMLAAGAASAQDLDCTECHDDVTVMSPAHPDFACTDCHTNVDDEHPETELEPLADADSCGGCHRRTIREIGRSVHDEQAGCLDCHGAAHEIRLVADVESAVSAVNQIRNCGNCHAGNGDIVEAYVRGVHGHGLLTAGLAASASCSDCHGAHAIDPVDDDGSPVAQANVPETCGACHSLLLQEWTTMSSHGIGWAEGNAEVPVCTDCHDEHGIAEPHELDIRLHSTEHCGDCHQEYMTTFRDSFHGKANELGFGEVATCADCHTPHDNLPASDPRSSVHPDNLVETCGRCHEGMTASFISFQPHIDPSNPDDNIYVYVVYVFMIGLLIGVFAFFGIHDVLWLQRAIVGAVRGEFAEERDASGPYIRRFSKMNIRLHLTIIVTFLLLALTGLPLKFNDTTWAQQLIALLGGVQSSTFIHHMAGLATFGYAIFHLGNLFIRFFVKRERGMFWGPHSLVPQPKDIGDLLRNFRYFLYLGKKPEHDRWNYIEKFDYLAVFWGVMIIGVSGLILWFPTWFATYFPGWIVNAAYVVHSDEALLATGFIFFFHFFHTHLRPESFPMDTVIFTGKLSLTRFKAERPLEYRRLVETGELDQYLVDPPTAEERRSAYIWGTLFLLVGLALAAGIVWALVTH